MFQSNRDFQVTLSHHGGTFTYENMVRTWPGYTQIQVRRSVWDGIDHRKAKIREVIWNELSKDSLKIIADLLAETNSPSYHPAESVFFYVYLFNETRDPFSSKLLLEYARKPRERTLTRDTYVETESFDAH